MGFKSIFKSKEKSDEKDKNVTDLSEYKYEKKKKKAQKRRIIVSGVIILIALIVVIFRADLNVYNVSLLLNNAVSTVKGDDISQYIFVEDENNRYDYYKGQLVVASADGVRLILPAKQGKAFIGLSYSDMKIQVNNSIVIAYDQNRPDYSIIKENKLYKSLKADGPILGINLTPHGNYAIITDEVGYKGVVSVYNGDLKPVYKYYSAKNRVLSAYVSPDCKKMAVVYADTQNSEVGGGILFFDFNKQEPTASHTFSNQMPLDVNYKDSRLITVLHTGGITNFNSSGNVVNEYSFESLVPYYASINPDAYACVMLGQDAQGDSGVLHIIDNNGRLKGTYQPKGTVKRLLTTNGNVVLYMENQIVILDFDAKQRRIIELDGSVKDIVLTQWSDIFLIQSGRAERIKF